MKVTITGASGFVGENLVAYLDTKKVSVSRLSLRHSKWEAEFNSDVNAIVHLAGKAHDTSNVADPAAYYHVNTDLTVKLFDRFLDSEIKDFIYYSSVKAVADTVEGVLTEDHIPAPETPYGKSKLQAEQYILGKQLPEGKRVFVIRPCMIHGPGNKGNLNLLYKIVKLGLPWPLANFRNKRSFLSIDNLSFLTHQLLIKDSIPSGIYNFADDDVLSTNEVVGVISEVLNKKGRLWRIPVSAMKRLARLGDRIGLPLNSERLKKLTESYVVSNEKVKESLGIQRLPVGASEGLKKTIRSFKDK